MHQLGGAESGRISYDEFVRRRRELDQMKARCLTRSSTEDDFWPLDLEHYDDTDHRGGLHREEYFPELDTRRTEKPVPAPLGDDKLLWLAASKGRDSRASRSGSMAASSSAKHESSVWEFDSGLPSDLVDDQMSIHRQIESQGIAVPPNCIELLEVANNVR